MKKLLMVALVVMVGVGGWRYWRHDAADNLLVDRIWIDHLPRNDRDTVQVMVLVNEEAIGVFGAASQWRAAHELFRFEHNGNELRVVYPQTGEREKIQARATRCHEGGMDFCLEVRGASRGVKRYYSQEGWEIGGMAAAQARIAAIAGGY